MPVVYALPSIDVAQYRPLIAEINTLFHSLLPTLTSSAGIGAIQGQIEKLVNDFGVSTPPGQITGELLSRNNMAVKLASLFQNAETDFSRDKSSNMLILALHIFWLKKAWDNINSQAAPLPFDNIVKEYIKLLNTLDKIYFSTDILTKITFLFGIIGFISVALLLYNINSQAIVSGDLSFSQNIFDTYCPNQPLLQKNDLLYVPIDMLSRVMCCEDARNNFPNYETACPQTLQYSLDELSSNIAKYNQAVLSLFVFAITLGLSIIGCISSIKYMSIQNDESLFLYSRQTTIAGLYSYLTTELDVRREATVELDVRREATVIRMQELPPQPTDTPGNRF